MGCDETSFARVLLFRLFGMRPSVNLFNDARVLSFPREHAQSGPSRVSSRLRAIIFLKMAMTLIVQVSKPSLGRDQFTRQESYELPEGRGTSGCNVNYTVSVGSSPGNTLSRPCRLFRVRNPDHVWSSHLCVVRSDPLALLTNPAIALLYCFVGV